MSRIVCRLASEGGVPVLKKSRWLSTYAVECLRDEKHGETFVIVLLSKSQLQWLSRRLTEDKVRSEMLNMGLSDDQIENAIRQAREQADSKQ